MEPRLCRGKGNKEPRSKIDVNSEREFYGEKAEKGDREGSRGGGGHFSLKQTQGSPEELPH